MIDANAVETYFLIQNLRDEEAQGFVDAIEAIEDDKELRALREKVYKFGCATEDGSKNVPRYDSSDLAAKGGSESGNTCPQEHETAPTILRLGEDSQMPHFEKVIYEGDGEMPSPVLMFRCDEDRSYIDKRPSSPSLWPEARRPRSAKAMRRVRRKA